MKKGFLLFICMLGFPLVSNATIVPSCYKDAASTECQVYLGGVVDGALMYKPSSVGVRLEESGGYESRALKFRGGKRYQEANRTFCAQRIPDRSTLVSGLTEAISTGGITGLASLELAVRNMLDCQRLQ